MFTNFVIKIRHSREIKINYLLAKIYEYDFADRVVGIAAIARVRKRNCAAGFSRQWRRLCSMLC